MAIPAVFRWASIRLPSCSRFRKPPYDPGRRDFPGPVLTLAFSSTSLPKRGEAQVLACIHPARRRFTHQLVPASRVGCTSAQSPRATLGPPSAQSPFASLRCYRREGGMHCLLEGRYPFVVAHTDSCARPVALHPASAWPRADGLCRLLPAPAGHRPFPTLSLPILPRVSGPLLRLPQECTYPLLPPEHWPSPR